MSKIKKNDIVETWGYADDSYKAATDDENQVRFTILKGVVNKITKLVPEE